jgi:Mn2+/Fe2+ NRAMP family transporter
MSQPEPKQIAAVEVVKDTHRVITLVIIVIVLLVLMTAMFLLDGKYDDPEKDGSQPHKFFRGTKNTIGAHALILAALVGTVVSGYMVMTQ